MGLKGGCCLVEREAQIAPNKAPELCFFAVGIGGVSRSLTKAALPSTTETLEHGKGSRVCTSEEEKWRKEEEVN